MRDVSISVSSNGPLKEALPYWFFHRRLLVSEILSIPNLMYTVLTRKTWIIMITYRMSIELTARSWGVVEHNCEVMSLITIKCWSFSFVHLILSFGPRSRSFQEVNLYLQWESWNQSNGYLAVQPGAKEVQKKADLDISIKWRVKIFIRTSLTV